MPGSKARSSDTSARSSVRPWLLCTLIAQPRPSGTCRSTHTPRSASHNHSAAAEGPKYTRSRTRSSINEYYAIQRAGPMSAHICMQPMQTPDASRGASATWMRMAITRPPAAMVHRSLPTVQLWPLANLTTCVRVGDHEYGPSSSPEMMHLSVHGLRQSVSRDSRLCCALLRCLRAG